MGFGLGSALSMGAGAVGSYLNARGEKKGANAALGAMRFLPYDIDTLTGNVRFKDGKATASSAFGDIFSGLRGGAAAGVDPENLLNLQGQDLSQYGLGQIGGLYDQFQSASMLDPRILSNFNNAMAAGGGPADLFRRGAQAFDANFQGLADERLGLLRQQAAPFEERAGNQFRQQLFNRGVLNENTGSSILAEGFGRGMAQADLSRQLEAQNFATNQLQNERAFGTQLFGLGSALNQQGFQANMGFADAGMNRAQARLAGAQGLFGFGQGITDLNLNRSINQLNAMLGIGADQRAGIALGGQLGSAQSAAGAAMAPYHMKANQSPLGQMLSSFGMAGMSGGGGGIGSLFGGGGGSGGGTGQSMFGDYFGG